MAACPPPRAGEVDHAQRGGGGLYALCCRPDPQTAISGALRSLPRSRTGTLI